MNDALLLLVRALVLIFLAYYLYGFRYADGLDSDNRGCRKNAKQTNHLEWVRMLIRKQYDVPEYSFGLAEACRNQIYHEFRCTASIRQAHDGQLLIGSEIATIRYGDLPNSKSWNSNEFLRHGMV